jgi:O-acetyl-ADP-ribose deacetylase (regulator of RNase III)
MAIHYVTGDATRPPAEEPAIIVHVCNDVGAWGAGIVLALSRRWAGPEERYRSWHQGAESIPFELGQVQFVQVEERTWVANLIGQHGIRRRGATAPVRYEAIREGLRRVAERALAEGASVHMPRIGCGLAGGKWEEVERLIEDELGGKGVEVTVYDLPAQG